MTVQEIIIKTVREYDFTSCPRHAKHVGSKPKDKIPSKIRVYKSDSRGKVGTYKN